MRSTCTNGQRMASYWHWEYYSLHAGCVLSTAYHERTLLLLCLPSTSRHNSSRVLSHDAAVAFTFHRWIVPGYSAMALTQSNINRSITRNSSRFIAIASLPHVHKEHHQTIQKGLPYGFDCSCNKVLVPLSSEVLWICHSLEHLVH